MSGICDRLGLKTPEAHYEARRWQPISKGPSRLEEKAAKAKAADQAWEACKRIVDARDGMRCRCCRRRVEKVIDLTAKRAEHHHIVRRRKEPALLVDPRNIVLICLKCHLKVTKRELSVMGASKDWFELNGQKFVNADKPLRFVPWKKRAA